MELEVIDYVPDSAFVLIGSFEDVALQQIFSGAVQVVLDVVIKQKLGEAVAMDQLMNQVVQFPVGNSVMGMMLWVVVVRRTKGARGGLE